MIAFEGPHTALAPGCSIIRTRDEIADMYGISAKTFVCRL